MTKSRWHALILTGILAAAAQSAQGQMLWFEEMFMDSSDLDALRDVRVEECPAAIRRTIRQRFRNETIMRIRLLEAAEMVLPDGTIREIAGGCNLVVETNGLRYWYFIDHAGAVMSKGLAPVKEAEFALENAPPLIREAVRREADGADVTDANVKMGVFRGAKFERAIYCVALKLDGEESFILLDADGTILDMARMNVEVEVQTVF